MTLTHPGMQGSSEHPWGSNPVPEPLPNLPFSLVTGPQITPKSMKPREKRFYKVSIIQ